MRFGCFVPQGWRLDLVGVEPTDQWTTMLEVARTIEAAGYESLWVYDHVHTVPVPTQEACHEAWSLMAALAAATDTVRLGQMCTCNAYRPPSYLAKIAATVDVISGGRLELGIGAGWYEHEFRGYGYEFGTAGSRLSMLAEAVEIIGRMWTEEVVEFAGQHYQLAGAICAPKPLQDPHVPMWIAGGGERKTLALAAQHASYTNFGGSVDEFAHKSTVLAAHCDRVGRSVSEITRSTNFNVLIGSTEAEVAERRSWLRSHYAAFVGDDRVDAMLDAVFVERGGLIGTPEQIVEQLRPWADAGLGYAICYFAEAAYDRSGIELFASEVAPALG